MRDAFVFEILMIKLLFGGEFVYRREGRWRGRGISNGGVYIDENGWRASESLNGNGIV